MDLTRSRDCVGRSDPQRWLGLVELFEFQDLRSSQRQRHAAGAQASKRERSVLQQPASPASMPAQSRSSSPPAGSPGQTEPKGCGHRPVSDSSPACDHRTICRSTALKMLRFLETGRNRPEVTRKDKQFQFLTLAPENPGTQTSDQVLHPGPVDSRAWGERNATPLGNKVARRVVARYARLPCRVSQHVRNFAPSPAPHPRPRTFRH